MSKSKFRYIIFPDGMYQVTIEDYDGKPYTFEISGEAIATHLRREALLDKQWAEQYNEEKNGETNEI